ncbi:hypothetical protein FHP25_28770 [Vineibacter terrae]|uniref:Uncharacterized protein n=1 Tax=Vineibacter terrae TaxID=2586908 RepID=A0A5C8PDT9_9HYPH|nr:hypothetical protein [Vineibacter terrae]TXL71687.1 hypothetical protein FHP25_28770 [Vineibacter terrae]
MAKKPAPLPNALKPWAEAQQRFHLSHAHVQMARELGLNPKKLGKLVGTKQQPWKLKLPDYIVKLYAKNFGKTRPDVVRSLAEVASAQADKKAAGHDRKAAMRVSLASFEAHHPPWPDDDQLIPEAPDYEGVVDEAESPPMWT